MTIRLSHAPYCVAAKQKQPLGCAQFLCLISPNNITSYTTQDIETILQRMVTTKSWVARDLYLAARRSSP